MMVSNLNNPLPNMKKLLSAGVIAFGLLSTEVFVHGQTTWDGGGGNDSWTTPENWIGDSVPLNNGSASVVFAGATRLTPQLNVAQDINQIIFASGASSFDVGGGSLTLQAASFSAGGSPIINNSSVLQTISAGITMGGSGNSGIRTDGGALALTGAFATTSHKMIVDGANNLTISGNVSGSGFGGGSLLLNTGFGGVVTLSGSNTYTGNNEVRNGILRVLSDNALGAGSAEVVLNSSTATPSLIVGGAFTVGHNIRVDGTTPNAITVGGDTADTATYTGSVRLGNSAGRALTVTAAAGGTVRFEGNLLNSVSGSDDADTVTKIGSGTVILAGSANTYSGSTTVSAGTLLINGDNSGATGNVTVSSGATLGGTGTIGALISTINDGGFLAAGASPGTLTFSGSLSFAGGAGGAGATAIFEGGDLVIADTLTLNTDWNLTLLTGFQDGGSVTLFNYTTAGATLDLTPDFDISGLGFVPTSLNTTLEDTGSSIILHGISVVPEPATMVLLGLGLAGMLFLRNHRRSA